MQEVAIKKKRADSKYEQDVSIPTTPDKLVRAVIQGRCTSNLQEPNPFKPTIGLTLRVLRHYRI